MSHQPSQSDPKRGDLDREQPTAGGQGPLDQPTLDQPPGPDHADEAAAELYACLAPRHGPDELGRLGPYRVLQLLGQGGMGAVFLAEDGKLKRQVALKVMRPKAALSQVARQRFLREAQATAAIEHDHIVAIYQVDEDRGVPYLAMPLLKGEPLDRWLERGRKPSVSQALRIGREIARGLAAAHAKGLVHRDIKPANIWLEAPQGRVKILDFGLARAAGDQANLTQNGMIVGTPAYMAPEQARSEPVDHRCDLFSLGCVLYRLTTGRQPFRGQDTMSILMALALETPPPARALNPEVPEALSALVAQLLAKDPAGRPGSAKDVVKAIQAIESSLSGVAGGPLSVAVAAPVVAEANPFADLTEPGSKVMVPPKPLAASQAPEPRTLASVPRPPFAGARGSGARRRAVLGGAGVLLALGLAAVLFVLPRNRQGPEVARATVPDGGWTAAERSGPRFGPEVARATAPDSGPGTVRPNPGNGGKPLPLLPGASPLDALRREQIPPAELAAAGNGDPKAAPGELVAIWGDSRLKHWAAVQKFDFSPDGRYLASAGSYGDRAGIRVWDLDTGREAWNYKVSSTRWSIAFSPNGQELAVARIGSGEITFLDAATGRLNNRMIRQKGIIFDLAFRPDGQRLAAACDATVQIADVEKGRVLLTLPGHTNIHYVAYSPDGKRLATGSEGGAIKIWDADKDGPAVVAMPDGPGGSITSVAWSPDGKYLATGRNANRLTIWDPDTGQVIRQLGPIGKGSYKVAFSPDGTQLAVGAADGKLELWDSKTGQPNQVFQTSGGFVTQVAFSSEGRRLAASSGDGTVKVWEVATGKLVQPAVGQQGIISQLALSPDQRSLASASLDGTIQLWDLETGRRTRLLTEPINGVNGIAWGSDGKSLYSAGGLGDGLHQWIFNPNGPDHDRLIPNKNFDSLCLRPDGRQMALGVSSAVGGGPIKIVEAPTGGEIRELPIKGSYIGGFCYSRDGRRLAAVARPTGKIWDADSGQEICTFTPGAGYQFSLSFSPDGQRLAVPGNSGVSVRDTATGQEIARLPCYSTTVAYSPDGRLLASCGPTGELVLFDSATDKPRHAWTLPGAARSLVFDATGRYLLTGNGNGTIYVFRLGLAKE